MKNRLITTKSCTLTLALILVAAASSTTAGATSDLDTRLAAVLQQAGFTGNVEATLEERLGRPIDDELAEVGRMLFFDNFLGLHGDNSCAGCHSPTAGFGDTQSIAIGVDSNGVVGPNRRGPRNQRRTPMVLNTAFYPKLMWNGRFSAPTGDPFDNSLGFEFPAPEGTTKFPPNDPQITHLLVAQAHIPPTELPEMAGFTGIRNTTFSTSRFQQIPLVGKVLRMLLPDGRTVAAPRNAARLHAMSFSVGPNTTADELDFGQFDDGHGVALPPADETGTRNEPIRQLVLARLNQNAAYRARFAAIYPEVAAGGPITFAMVGQALAEFQISLTFADAPIDRFARGERSAMTSQQKRGALLFFGRAGCVRCHAVAGDANEMFSDFEMHNIGIPQIAPFFGAGKGNVAWRDQSGAFSVRGNQDFGLEDITGQASDRYKFRTSPLRNVAMQPTFFHNGTFTELDDAIRHHLDVTSSALLYNPALAGVDWDLLWNRGPILPVLQRLDPAMQLPILLTPWECSDLIAFVRDGLLDERARPDSLRALIPDSVPSGARLPIFE